MSYRDKDQHRATDGLPDLEPEVIAEIPPLLGTPGGGILGNEAVVPGSVVAEDWGRMTIDEGDEDEVAGRLGPSETGG